MKQHSQQIRESSSGSSSIKRCAIYTRKSTGEGLDRDFNTLDAQRETAEAYIESQKNEGWICLPEHYDDGGFTGGNLDRPAMMRLMADIETDKIDCIVVYKVDRLSRSLMDFSRIMTILEQHDVSFVSVTQQFNTTHSMGRLTLNILLSFSQFEREIISERTRDKMNAARKKGKWIGGTPVLGYDIDPRRKCMIVNFEEAFKVRRIFELYLDHQSLRATIKELNNMGWFTKRWVTAKERVTGGKAFQIQSLFRLLTDVTYLGKIKFKGTIYEGEHEAIVDETKWQQVQKILKRNGSNGGKLVRNKYGALLKGLLYCKPCQAAMIHTIQVSKSKNTKYRFYVCSSAQIRGWHTCPTKSVSVAEIEGFVINLIRNMGRDSDLVAETVKQVRKCVQDRTEMLENELWIINEKLKRNIDEVDKLTSNKILDFNDQSFASSRLSTLDEQIRIARIRTDEIRDKISKMKIEKVEKRELTKALKDFNSIWESLLLRERVRLIHLLVKRIDYDGAEEMLSLTFHQTGIKTLVEDSCLA